MEIAKTKPTFEGEISTQQHADAWRKDIESSKVSEQTKAVLYEILPLVKENLDYQKEQYGAEKEHTIVIPRREYDGSNVGRDKKRSTLWGDKKYRPKETQLRNAEADRRGESADAQEVDFNIISSVYDKREDSVARWVNDGKMLWVDKKKALDYFSVSAPLAEAQNNQELISTTKVIQNFESPKIEPRYSLRELDAPYLEAVERGDMETAQRMELEATKLYSSIVELSYPSSGTTPPPRCEGRCRRRA